MQDSGQGSGRDAKGRFVKGHVGNPHGRAGRQDPPQTVRLDAAERIDADLLDPEKALNLIRMDGWQNQSTGLGVPGFDKRLNTRFISEIVTYRDAVELWRSSDIAAVIIEDLPKESLKKGYELQIADEGDYGDLKDQVEQLFDELQINENLETALCFERAYGGGALLLGVNDGQDMSMPLNMDGIIEFQWVTPLEPIELYPLSTYTDPYSNNYGKPELYQLNAIAQGPTMGMVDPMSRTLPTTSVIHESRLIIFPGLRVSKYQARNAIGGLNWGDSVLNRVVRVIADYDLAFASAGIILSEQGLPIFHMKELAKLVNSNRQDIIKARLALLFQQMSTARAAVIDSEENYERKAMPLTGLSDVLDRLGMRMAAAANMPVTRILRQSPKGLGNEGESDMEGWYDSVATYQNQKVRRPVRKLLQIALRALSQQEPAKWSPKFHPLKQLSDMEKAQARSAQMSIDVGYIQAGVLTVEEVRMSRFTGEYSFETQLDEEAWAAQNAAQQQPLTPEDMMAMGLDPNNPEDVAKAEQMQAEQAAAQGGGVDPMTGEPVPPGEGEPQIDPETGEPVPPGEGEPQIDPETGEPIEAPDPETGETKAAAKPGVPAFGKKPAPFGKPAPLAKKPEVDPETGEPIEAPEGEGEEPEVDPETGEPIEAPEGEGEEPEVEPIEAPEGEEPQLDPAEEEELLKAVKEGEIDSQPDDGRRFSGETDADRKRQASTAPGVTHIADRDGDGKVTTEERQQTIDEIMAAIAQLKQQLGKSTVQPVQKGAMLAKKPGAAPMGKPAPKKPAGPPVDEEPAEDEEADDKAPPFGRPKRK